MHLGEILFNGRKGKSILKSTNICMDDLVKLRFLRYNLVGGIRGCKRVVIGSWHQEGGGRWVRNLMLSATVEQRKEFHQNDASAHQSAGFYSAFNFS